MITGPKITVITVCFNSEATIGAAIQSVIGQDYENVEHILVDGSSADATMDIVRGFEGHLAKIISEPDKGIYDAMNKGLRYATGDYIAFLNSDDIYAHENVLSRVARAVEEKAPDAIFADVCFVRADEPDNIVRHYRSARFSPDNLRYGWMMAHPSLFLKRTVFESVGAFDDSFRIAGDFEFVARAFKGGRLNYVYLPEVFVRMTLGGASTSGMRALLRMNREVMRACRQNGIKTSWLRLLSRYPAKLTEFLVR